MKVNTKNLYTERQVDTLLEDVMSGFSETQSIAFIESAGELLCEDYNFTEEQITEFLEKLVAKVNVYFADIIEDIKNDLEASNN